MSSIYVRYIDDQLLKRKADIPNMYVIANNSSYEFNFICHCMTIEPNQHAVHFLCNAIISLKNYYEY